MSLEDDYYYIDPGTPYESRELTEASPSNTEASEESEDDARYAWKVASWIIVVLTLILNLVIVGVIVINRNANSVVNKGKTRVLKHTNVCTCMFKYNPSNSFSLFLTFQRF